MGVHCKTSNNACYSELGRLPVIKKIITFATKYLDHLISLEHTLAHDIFIKTKETNTWFMHIKTCLNNLGFSYLTNFNVSLRPVLGIVKQRVHDQILQEQNASVMNSSKLSFYRNFCLNNKRAHYVDKLESLHDRSFLAKIRWSAHDLEIEKGRYIETNKNDRLCKICQNSDIENEKHFILHCPKYEAQRKIFLTKLSTFPNFKQTIHNNDNLLKLLMKTSCKRVLKILSSFLCQISDIRKNVLAMNE